jgi:hypothetical protein
MGRLLRALLRADAFCRKRRVRDAVALPIAAPMTERPTQQQLDQIKRLNKEARVPDESEIVTSRKEAQICIRDLKEKARIE